MRYVIDGFLQTKLIEFNLNERERKLLEFIGFVAGGKNTITTLVNGKNYIWLKYEAFINEYPYLEIPNTKQVGEHLKKLKEKGILDLHIDRTPRGTFTYIAFDNNYYALVSKNPQNYAFESDIPTAAINVSLHSDLEIKPLRFDPDSTPILAASHCDYTTHSDSNRSGNRQKSEWKVVKIGAESGQNRTQINQPTINQTTINQNNINQEYSKSPNFDLEDFVIENLYKLNFELNEAQIKQFIHWINLRKQHHKKLINNQTTILKQLKRLNASSQFAGIDHILDTTISGSDKTGKCYENILEITRLHPSKQDERPKSDMFFNVEDGFYYAEGLRINGLIDRKGNGSGYVNGVAISSDADKSRDPFWFDHLADDVKQEAIRRKPWKL